MSKRIYKKKCSVCEKIKTDARTRFCVFTKTVYETNRKEIVCDDCEGDHWGAI